MSRRGPGRGRAPGIVALAVVAAATVAAIAVGSSRHSSTGSGPSPAAPSSVAEVSATASAVLTATPAPVPTPAYRDPADVTFTPSAQPTPSETSTAAAQQFAAGYVAYLYGGPIAAVPHIDPIVASAAAGQQWPPQEQAHPHSLVSVSVSGGTSSNPSFTATVSEGGPVYHLSWTMSAASGDWTTISLPSTG